MRLNVTIDTTGQATRLYGWIVTSKDGRTTLDHKWSVKLPGKLAKDDVHWIGKKTRTGAKRRSSRHDELQKGKSK